MSQPPDSLSEQMPLSARVTGFMAHLRLNGVPVGPAETASALSFLSQTRWRSITQLRHGLRILLTGNQAEWHRFDELFEAYWLGRGRKREAPAREARDGAPSQTTTRLWSGRLGGDLPAVSIGTQEGVCPDAGEAPRTHAVKARVVASRQEVLRRVDLRFAADPEQSALAERLAYRLAKSMRYRLSRRRRFARRGDRLDLRRTIRRNLGRGGEPVTLLAQSRPERPVRVVLLLDVSGSMQPYSRFLLQFAKGLTRSWDDSDVFLFHTRLVRVSDVLNEKDALLAMTRLSVMARGFGGGTRMSECLREFNAHYAKRTLNSRTVFMIVSDGYDTGEPAELVAQLERLKRRVRRVVWLNPLLGWKQYRPVTRSMQAALPYVDHFAPAHSLQALAAVEVDLARL